MQNDITDATSKVTNKLSSWLDTFIENLPNLGIAVIVLITSFFISKYTSRFTKKIIKKRVSKDSIANIIAKTTATVIVLTGLFLALGVLNLSETLKSLLTGAGIAGIVIGMALQGTLSNTIAGVVLSFKDKIRIGDWVETNGFSGEVMDISLKEFTLKEADNNIVIIPNKTILENPLKNYTLTKRMRVTFNCGVGYSSDLELVENITKKAIKNAFEQIETENQVEFYYTEFGDSSINFLCRFWIEAESSLEKIRAKSRAIILVKKAFDKHNINIPFPIRTLQFDNSLALKQLSKLDKAAVN